MLFFFHLFETQFESTYIFLKLSPVGPYLSIKKGGGGQKIPSSKAKTFFFIQALLFPT